MTPTEEIPGTAPDAAFTGGAPDDWYTATETPEVTRFGPVHGLAVSGCGAPGGAEYGRCAGALYAVAGAVITMSGPTTPMPVLEGRWWVEDDRLPFDVPRDEWHWQLFLRMPSVVGTLHDEAREQVRADAGPVVSRVQAVTFTEGLCVQMLHLGEYADEPRSLALMDVLMRDEGLTPHGLHHEIYLSDVRETDPAVMRTILRQPVRGGN